MLRHDRLDRIRAIPYHPRTKEQPGIVSRVLTAADFVAHVGKTVTPKGQRRALTLISVDPTRRPGWDDMPREPFTLILRGPPGDALPEGLYDVTVDDGRDFTLYIIPIHTVARDRQDYQVVFN